MTNTEKILFMLRSTDWDAAPRAAGREDLDGATTYLQNYATFILENIQDGSLALTPFASPLQILGISDAYVETAVIEESQRLAAESPLAYEKVFALRALEWASLCESGHPATVGREDMFDPLLRLIVNRVPALIRKGNWVVDDSMYPLVDWINRYGKQTVKPGGQEPARHTSSAP